jgi:AraC family L-rhamnose operon transcriptional activator RhaR
MQTQQRSIRRSEVFPRGSIPIAARDVPAFHGVPEHTHDYLEIAVVSRGRGTHVTAEGRHPIHLGSVILIRPGTAHAYEEPEDLSTFNLYLAPELLHRELSWVIEYPELARALLGGRPNAGELDRASSDRVLTWLEQIAMFAGTAHSAALVGLTSCVLDSFTQLAEKSDFSLDSTIARSVITMMSLMQSDLSFAWSIADLTRATNTSSSVVHRAFNAHVGTSPMSWLNRARSERFATELVLTQLPIAGIGRLVGWDDPNYASRRFKAEFGLTPTEYRRRFTQ